jgi:hypothetical protein
MEQTKQSAPGPARPSLLEAGGKPALAAPYLDFEAVIERARNQRNEEIRSLFGRFFAWIRTVFETTRRSDADRFLSGATDLADLERRMRDLVHGKNAFVR